MIKFVKNQKDHQLLQEWDSSELGDRVTVHCSSLASLDVVEIIARD